MSDPVERETIERLAKLEHQQWATWARGVIGEVSPERRARWEKFLALGYDRLPEDAKAKDREWAQLAYDEMKAAYTQTASDASAVLFMLRGHAPAEMLHLPFAELAAVVLREFQDAIQGRQHELDAAQLAVAEFRPVIALARKWTKRDQLNAADRATLEQDLVDAVSVMEARVPWEM